MEMRKLGRTDIDVSSVCLGSMTWGKQNSEAEAHEQLDYALDRGVNFIDTAEMYPVPGEADAQGPALEEPTTHAVADGSVADGRGGLFPSARDGRVVHFASPDARVCRSGRSLVVTVGLVSSCCTGCADPRLWTST